MSHLPLPLGLSLGIGLLSLPAQAEEPTYDPYRPEPGLFELGLYGGAFITSDRHELYEVGVARHQPLTELPPELGLRAGWYPLSFLGAELEGGAVFAATRTGPATPYVLRAQAVAQVPWSRIRPFLLAGGGLLGVASPDDQLGDDRDPAFHWGLGAKALVTPGVALRLDGRHVLAPAQDEVDRGELTSHFEVLLGASIILGHSDDPDPDGDRVPADQDRCPKEAGVPPDGCVNLDPDGDGVPEPADLCPTVASPRPDGCPDPDPDQDGVPAAEDRCPDQVGVAPDGCPDPDPDRDGVRGAADLCPNEAASTADGCPPRDPDGDGFTSDVDRCPEAPESKNGYQDQDGCPDELPAEVQKFTGALKGIAFASGSAVITKASFPNLDEAAAVLNQFPDLKVEIGGHTDDAGKAERNQQLSAARAEAVRAYLVKKGVAEGRLTSVGYGSARPVADNTTPSGRAANRRIELQLLP